MFDYGNANEAQKEAINTVEGPVQSLRSRPV